MAAAIPKQHLSACHLINIVTKVIVRTKYQFGILRQLIDYLLGITTGDNDIRQSLHGSSCIYIADNLIARMLVLEFLQVLSLA